MFGLRLKSWMEAHLGRPRHKSTSHQNPKQQRAPKDSSASSCSSTTTNNTTTAFPQTSSVSAVSFTSSSGNPYPGSPFLEKNSNSESSSSSQFLSTTPSAGSNSVQAQSDTFTAQQHQKQQQQRQVESLKDHEEKIQQSTCTRSSTTGSVSNSTSNSILLGSFSNNLSSPDTGYSTDGYSPKSVYPALSFESSGKSTPKSSYTISSLVSSELLTSSKNTSISSASCSVQNGLELDECLSPVSLAPHPLPETDSPTADRIPRGSSSIGSELQPPLHSINHELTVNPVISSSQDRSRGNDTVTSKLCNSSTSVSHMISESSHDKNTMVAPTPNLTNFSSAQSHKNDNGSYKNFCGLSNPLKSHGITSPSPENNNLHLPNHHRRAESMDERTSKVSDGDCGGGNSSSLLTAANRNIRTSFVLASTTPTSQIPECNTSGLKNPFSICSPRRERTRIKTNPWITISQQNNDGNANTNIESNLNSGGPSKHSSPPTVRETTRMEKASFHHPGVSVTHNIQGNHTGVSCDPSKVILEINKRDEIDREGMHHPHLPDHESSSLVYRISTSTSASDSGKGSLEPGTNRNSTESSCLLSDSTASTRNSIISHEAVPGCSESRSRSSSSTTTDTFNNGHGLFFSTPQVESAADDQQSQSHQCTTNVNNVSVSSAKTVPLSTTRTGVGLVTLNSSQNDIHLSDLKSEQDVTTSVTLPPELISTSTKTNIMVDKETDILSDWANTDDDGEDEIETDQNDNEAVTPTPSSPDTDTGGRVFFPNSHSTSSATDIDFGDSSAATAASSTCIFPVTSSATRHHYSQNINKHSNGVAASPYHHHNNMNLPTTCYQSIPIIPTPGVPDMYAQERKEAYWNQSEPLANHVLIHQPGNVTLRGRCPSPGIPIGNISLSSLYPHPLDPDDYNMNKSSSHAIARGALGFLRKIFKKGSCSAQRTSPGSDKLKLKGKDSHHYIPSATGLRSPLLTAEALVSPHTLVNRKTSLNGYFLTPTPNAFRRRSGTGTDSSDSKSSKHHKSVKTDIIRLPLGALSPNQGLMQTSSSSTSCSQNTGAFGIPNFQNTVLGINSGQSNTNTNSTTASSVHSMSTSTSAASVGAGGVNTNNKTPRENQSRLNDNFYLNSNRQSPFMSHQQNVAFTMSPKPNSSGAHSAQQTKPQLPPIPPVSSHSHPSNITSQSHIAHHRDFPPNSSTTKANASAGHESPRLQNTSTHRINSPSFNNYSPIHRLVVTGGSHLHTRGPPNPSSHLIQIQSASSYNPESPLLTSRNGNTPLPHHPHGHNNNPNFTPIINRSVLPISTSTASPLINHRHSLSSPHPIHPSTTSYAHPGPHSFASPSPILRNPRYQYITSSNQNSPVLNVPKRINLPTPQHYPYHDHGAPSLSSNPNGLPPFSTFSPVPPPRQNANNNPFSAASPNLNHQQYPQARHRSGSVGCEFENANAPNLPGTTSGNGNIAPSSTSNRSNIISRSQSYQTHQIHYYASPVIPQPPPRLHPTIPSSLPSGFSNEPPLLMKTHLHNQNIRLNNFLQNKQRYNNHHPQNRAGRFPNSGSFQERIYETVDSEDDEGDISEDEEIDCGDNVRILAQNEHQMRTHKSHREFEDQGERNMCTRVGPESGFQYTHKSSKSRTQQSSKSRTSKPQQSQFLNLQPRPPVPMALFGPNTFLSETETRLLESDREADRKYKRLINEAEALLREISAVKSQQPWAHHDQERLRADDCPQSDPLRRKAYDCWALRRLQQELAGCCASPPVLHRSRMNLQSPSTPTGASQPYFIPNLSLAQEPSSSLIPTNPRVIENNRNNAHF